MHKLTTGRKGRTNGMKKLKIALIGLGFGGCFADIYHEHPDVGELVVFDTDKAL